MRKLLISHMLEYLCRYRSTYVQACMYRTQHKDWPIGSAVQVLGICFQQQTSKLWAPCLRKSSPPGSTDPSLALLCLQCSVSCGVGVMHRSVQCLTNDDQPSHLCPADLKPEERKTCHNIYNCKSANQSHVSGSWRAGLVVDALACPFLE